MYNRYIPQPDGSFRRSQIPEPANVKKQNPQQEHPNCKNAKENGNPVINNTTQVPPVRNNAASKYNCQKSDLTALLHKLLPNDFDTGDLIVILLLLILKLLHKIV